MKETNTYSQNDWRSYHLSHASQWVDENGNNTPAYNHKYWEEHKEEIMARRKALEAGLVGGKYYDDDADAYTKELALNASNYIREQRKAGTMSVEDMHLLQKEVKEEIARIEAKKNGQKKPVKKETASSDDEDGDKKKKGSGSSGSSKKKKSSDSKSSSKSSKGSTGTGTRPKPFGKLGNPAKDKAKAEKEAKKAEKEAKAKEKSSSGSKSSKSESEKKTAEKKTAEKKTTEEKTSATTKETTKSTSTEKTETTPVSKLKAAVPFSKIDSVISDYKWDTSKSPAYSFETFTKEAKNILKDVEDIGEVSTEELKDLWKEYRRHLGIKEDDLEHGLDLFDDYLEHHGRLGQKWGVRNGPPYPLSGGQMSSEYKKNGGVSKSAEEVYGGRKLSKKTGSSTKPQKARNSSGSATDAIPVSKKRTNKATGNSTAKNVVKEVRREAKSISNTVSKAASATAKGVSKAIATARANAAAKREQRKAEIARREAEAKKAIEESGLSEGDKKMLDYRREVYDDNDPDKVRKSVEALKQRREEEAAAPARAKEEAINSGDAQYAKEHFSELSNQELNAILARVDLNKRLDTALGINQNQNQNNNGGNQNQGQKKSWKEQTPVERVDTIIEGATKVKGWVDKGTDIWNTAAKLYNTFHPDDPLPTISADAVANAKKAKDNALAKSLVEGKMTFDDFVKKAGVSSVETVSKYMKNLNDISTKNKDVQKAMAESVPKTKAEERADAKAKKEADKAEAQAKKEADKAEKQAKKEADKAQKQSSDNNNNNNNNNQSSGDPFTDAVSSLNKAYADQQLRNQQEIEKYAKQTQDFASTIDDLKSEIDELKDRIRS